MATTEIWIRIWFDAQTRDEAEVKCEKIISLLYSKIETGAHSSPVRDRGLFQFDVEVLATGLSFEATQGTLNWALADARDSFPLSTPDLSWEILYGANEAGSSRELESTELRKMLLKGMRHRPAVERGARRIAWLYPGSFYEDSELTKKAMLFFEGGVAELGLPWDLQVPFREAAWLSEPLANAGLLHFVDSRQIFGDIDLFEDEIAQTGAFYGWFSLKWQIRENGSSGPWDAVEAWLGETFTDETYQAKLGEAADIALATLVGGMVLDGNLQIVPISDSASHAKAFRHQLMDSLEAQQPNRDRLTRLSRAVVQDLKVAVTNLEQVPLDEILDFRLQHINKFSRYVTDVERFAGLVAGFSSATKREEFEDLHTDLEARKEELLQARREIEIAQRNAWKTKASGFLSLATSADAVLRKSWHPAVISLIAAILSRRESIESVHWSSYLFSAGKRLNP